MAEALNCSTVIPVHYDVWTNFKTDPMGEILMLYNYKKDRLQYKFKPFIWEVGGKFVWPQDKDRLIYNYRRGFEACFTYEPNVPFRSIFIICFRRRKLERIFANQVFTSRVAVVKFLLLMKRNLFC